MRSIRCRWSLAHCSLISSLHCTALCVVADCRRLASPGCNLSLRSAVWSLKLNNMRTHPQFYFAFKFLLAKIPPASCVFLAGQHRHLIGPFCSFHHALRVAGYLSAISYHCLASNLAVGSTRHLSSSSILSQLFVVSFTSAFRCCWLLLCALKSKSHTYNCISINNETEGRIRRKKLFA